MKILALGCQGRANPRSGGAEIHPHQIYGRLAWRGSQVTLLSSAWPGAVRPRPGGRQPRTGE